MISTHVLDTSAGVPAQAVKLALEFRSDAQTQWTAIERGETNADGRYVFQSAKESGQYRLTFETGAYFAKRGVESFFPEVPILFLVRDLGRKYHVPLLVSPFGLSTYRGS